MASINNTLKCIVLDDEFPAVKLLSDYVRRTAGLELVLATTDALQALTHVNSETIDLLFLDIQMPVMTGLELTRAISGTATRVIFTTAYSQYAIDGFEQDAVDYILKPITYERFLRSVAKARKVTVPSLDIPDFIFIKTEYRLQRVLLADMLYIEGLRDYIVLYTLTGKLLSLERMRNMEALLPVNFLRIHKSYLINIDHIDFIERGRIVIGKERLPIGETYRQAIAKKLGI